jgi:hypothetical protein
MKDPQSLAEGVAPPPDEIKRTLILEHLARVQNSHAFGSSSRAKEFLSYVVLHALEGDHEMLKERSIGVNLFSRPPAYPTGDDPIVRVKAAEVRKRLAQFYAEEEKAPEVRIEIPVGAYVPRFHWKASPQAAPIPVESVTRESAAEPAAPKQRSLRGGITAAVVCLAVVGVAAVTFLARRAPGNPAIDAFWGPVFATGQPVLICIPSPVTYAAASQLFAQAAREHPGIYDTQVERDSTPLQLDPNTSIKWKDLTPLVDYSTNKDDAYVAADLSALFGWRHKASQVRIGRDFTYEDLRNSPAVLVGAFDNPATMRVSADLPFVFVEEKGGIVEEGGQKRVWTQVGFTDHGTKDFAVVGRLLNSKTGQFLVIVAGIGMVGTQAAGKFVSDEGEMQAALRSAPPGWQQKNMELVLESDVIDGSAAPPHVVAVKAW